MIVEVPNNTRAVGPRHREDFVVVVPVDVRGGRHRGGRSEGFGRSGWTAQAAKAAARQLPANIHMGGVTHYN